MPFVYALFDPAKPEDIRYVGVSSSPGIRLLQHIEEAIISNGHTHKLNWIRRVLKEGRSPEFRILCFETHRDACLVQERHYIRELRAAGVRLTNSTAGGEGIFEAVNRRRRKHRKHRALVRTTL